MSTKTIKILDHNVNVFDEGEGEGDPIIYLHGIADIPGLRDDLPSLKSELAKHHRVISPAHPACSGSDERDDLDTMEDLVLHYLDLLEALEIEKFHLVGSCMGGWVSAELAVRYPEKIKSLNLIGASGLFIKGHSIADLFWVAQPEDGLYYNDLRHLLFSSSESKIAKELFPDGRGDLDKELLRYGMFRFASRFGFSPPYMHNRKLKSRLRRYKGPALIVWGENDHLVPREHAIAYSKGLGNAPIEIIPECGHSVQVEAPAEIAGLLNNILEKNPS